MTFVLIGLRRSGNFLRRNVHIRKERNLTLQALFPLRRRLLPARKLLREFRSLGLPPLLFPALQVGRIRGGGLRVHLVLCPGKLPPLPLDLGRARGGGVSLDALRLRASAPLPLQLLQELVNGGCSFAADAPCPLRFLGCFSLFLTARSTTWGTERSFGGLLPRCVLPWFPIFGSRSAEG